MSAAKIWKALDIVGQILCVLVPWLKMDRYVSEDDFFMIYFIIGAWQVLSFMAHRATKEKDNTARSLYGFFLLMIVVCGILCTVLMIGTGGLSIILYMMVMMFAGPVMAVFYFVICVVEFIYLLYEQEQITDYETSDSE